MYEQSLSGLFECNSLFDTMSDGLELRVLFLKRLSHPSLLSDNNHEVSFAVVVALHASLDVQVAIVAHYHDLGADIVLVLCNHVLK